LNNIFVNFVFAHYYFHVFSKNKTSLGIEIKQTMSSIRTRSVTPVGGRITINRTIGIQTPPRSKKKLRCQPSSELEAFKPKPTVMPQPVSASKPGRRNSADEMPRKDRALRTSQGGRSSTSSRRLIKRKTRELKAQRRRDKYRELFLRQQALALERLAQQAAPADVNLDQPSKKEAAEAAEKGEEECKKEIEEEEEEVDRPSRKQRLKKRLKKEQKAVAEDGREPVIYQVSVEGEYEATLSDLLDSSSESEQPDAEVLPHPPGEKSPYTGTPPEAGFYGFSEHELTESRHQSCVSVDICPNVKAVVAQAESHSVEAVRDADVDKETEVVIRGPERPRAVRRKSAGQSGRQPRIVQNLADKAYGARILLADPKIRKQPTPSASCKFSELDRDERDLMQILKEAKPLAAARRGSVGMRKPRRGEPTFEEPDRTLWTGGPGAQLTELLSQMRRRSRIAQRRAAFLCRRVHVLSKNCYWATSEEAGKESPSKKPYTTFILAPDQIR
jgi:hypothetical protein